MKVETLKKNLSWGVLFTLAILRNDITLVYVKYIIHDSFVWSINCTGIAPARSEEAATVGMKVRPLKMNKFSVVDFTIRASENEYIFEILSCDTHMNDDQLAISYASFPRNFHLLQQWSSMPDLVKYRISEALSFHFLRCIKWNCFIKACCTFSPIQADQNIVTLILCHICHCWWMHTQNNAILFLGCNIPVTIMIRLVIGSSNLPNNA